MANKIGTTLFVAECNSNENGNRGELIYTYAGGAASGDTITFSGDVAGKLPNGAILLASSLLIPGATASLTASVGYASTDGDVTATNATNTTYFNSATAVATAGRYAEVSANPYLLLPKDAWPIVTIGGASLPAGAISLRISYLYPKPIVT